MPLYHTTMVMIIVGSDWATAVFALLLGVPLKHAPQRTIWYRALQLYRNQPENL